MSLKLKQIIKIILKISTLSFALVISFFIINNFAGAYLEVEVEEKEKHKLTNEENYKNIIIQPIANVWVAIASNIWLWLKKSEQILETNINSNVFKIEDFYINSDNIKQVVIKKNLIFTKEYLNIIWMNFNWIIKKSNNKIQTVNNIIRQLEIRYKNANINSTTLTNQNKILLTNYNSVKSELDSLRFNLEKDFTLSNEEKVFIHMDNYYDLKNKEAIIRTNILLINELLKRYKYLNNINKKLLDNFILNKVSISNWTYIVIPDSWNELLKEFNLIYTEEEFREKEKNKD